MSIAPELHNKENREAADGVEYLSTLSKMALDAEKYQDFEEVRSYILNSRPKGVKYWFPGEYEVGQELLKKFDKDVFEGFDSSDFILPTPDEEKE